MGQYGIKFNKLLAINETITKTTNTIGVAILIYYIIT